MAGDHVVQSSLAELISQVSVRLIQSGFVRAVRRVGSRAVAPGSEARRWHGGVDVGLRSRSGHATGIVAADASLSRRRRGELVDQFLEGHPLVVRTAWLLACLEVRSALLDERFLLWPYQTMAQFF